MYEMRLSGATPEIILVPRDQMETLSGGKCIPRGGYAGLGQNCTITPPDGTTWVCSVIPFVGAFKCVKIKDAPAATPPPPPADTTTTPPPSSGAPIVVNVTVGGPTPGAPDAPTPGGLPANTGGFVPATIPKPTDGPLFSTDQIRQFIASTPGKKGSDVVKLDEVMTYAFAAGGIWLGWKIVQSLFDFADHPAPGFLDAFNDVFRLDASDDEPRMVQRGRNVPRGTRPIVLKKNAQGIYEPV